MFEREVLKQLSAWKADEKEDAVADSWAQASRQNMGVEVFW
ncbi:hypothetical protein AAE250_15600 [Bacteroides sp. GD17]|jgi:hypothetical protein